MIDELRSALARPAVQADGRFEPGLVNALIDQSLNVLGALPLLQYTLQELWKQHSPEGRMTWATYRQLGGIEGALAKRAGAILAQHYAPRSRPSYAGCCT